VQGISVIVPTLDGLALLRANLPPLLREMDRYPGEAELIVADDGSQDGTAGYIAGLGGRVRLCPNAGPRGFGRNCNHAAGQARHELLFLLNNDVRVTPGVLAALAGRFADERLFGVCPNSFIRKDGVARNEMPNRGRWEDGLLLSQVCPPGDAPRQPAYDTFHLCGGFALVRRDVFLRLGGFDDLFDPFYFEDVDLSLTARRCGWRLAHDATATVLHAHQGTIRRRFARCAVRRIAWRNAFLFNWKHLDADMIERRHLPALMDRASSALRKDAVVYAGFLDALPLYPQVLARRRRLEALGARPLRDVLEPSEQPPP
jgi:GT2 family glycosyltransferase